MLARLCLIFWACLSLGAQVNSYSKEKEAALGAKVAAEIRQEAGSIESAPVEDYLARLGARLTALLPETGFSWSFSVTAREVGGEIHEPFPAPGGNILVPASLFTTALDEGEFAGMLAHAVAHAAARNGALRAPYGRLLFNAVWIPLDPMTPGLTAMTRGFEREADQAAVRIMADAGYDPQALARYIARVQMEHNQRLADIRREIQALPRRLYYTSGEFPAVQEEVRRLRQTTNNDGLPH